MFFFEAIFLGVLACIVIACGSRETEIRYEDHTTPKEYTWDDMKAKCFTCHNSSAPQIPVDEAGFKSSEKVKLRISGGSMPPNKDGFDKAAALSYLEK